MISHRHKFIFIHIPKCAGSSIKNYYFNSPKLDWRVVNYDLLYGWCPKRNLHLQHATPKELLEQELISEEDWKSYFKFSFVRNPWDRAYSDYLWIKKDRKVKGSFKNYLNRQGEFYKIFKDNTVKEFRGDHLTQQTEYVNEKYELDFIGKFEKLHSDINSINKVLNFHKEFNIHEKRNSNKLKHYSLFYSNSDKNLFDSIYFNDIKALGYSFEDKRTGIYNLKKFF